MSTHVVVDRSACAGHGLCYSTAPDVFDADEQGDPIVLLDPVPADQVENADAAVAACPEQALRLEQR